MVNITIMSIKRYYKELEKLLERMVNLLHVGKNY